MNPTIAVVIPNRNDAKHLRKSLESVFDQEILPDQIIVIDDQSTDDSLDVINEKLHGLSWGEIIVNPDCLGTMGAANEGLKHVTTDYVLFLSSNDYLRKGIFKRAKSCLAANDEPGVWSALVSTIDEAGNPLSLYPSPVISFSDAYFNPAECIRLAKIMGHWFTGTTLVFHRKTLQAIGGFDETYQGLADMLAAITIASLKGASFTPEPFGVMRQHSGGLMWRTATNLPLLDTILDKMQREGPKLSPSLFTSEFCELMRRRVRFTAIRSFHDNGWQKHLRSWKGGRYRALSSISTFVQKHRRLQLVFAFLFLRPIQDIFTIVFYRYLGSVYVKVRGCC